MGQFSDSRAAIVCSHIAQGGFPILGAIRTEPLEPEDSGWQFVCNTGNAEKESEAQVWLVSEVLSLEPSLSLHMNSPIGTKLSRLDKNSKWETSPE
jgi:hypothetical protein